ncbi:restriction endonuclease subunit S [Micrococcus luteus]|nr:restriction endonuclease subunit S [Micrococcus luteus]
MGIVPSMLDGAVASTGFTVLRDNEKVAAPGFVWCVVSHQAFTDDMVLKATGSNYPAIRPADVSGYHFMLPPLEEQRRIVDLIGAVDKAIESAEAEAGALASIGGNLVETMALEATGGSTAALGDHGTFQRGKRFTKSDYTETGLPCIHYGQIYTSLGPVTSEPLTWVPEEMAPKLRFADPGDVIVATTSENVEDVGKATLWAGTAPAAFHDDSYAYKHSLNPVFAAHLFTMPSFHQQKRNFAAGMKVMRLSGNSLASIALPIPARDVQDKIAETALALTSNALHVSDSLANLRELRSNLLTALLSGEHEIPESYDDLLEVTA